MVAHLVTSRQFRGAVPLHLIKNCRAQRASTGTNLSASERAWRRVGCTRRCRLITGASHAGYIRLSCRMVCAGLHWKKSHMLFRPSSTDLQRLPYLHGPRVSTRGWLPPAPAGIGLPRAVCSGVRAFLHLAQHRGRRSCFPLHRRTGCELPTPSDGHFMQLLLPGALRAGYS